MAFKTIIYMAIYTYMLNLHIKNKCYYIYSPYNFFHSHLHLDGDSTFFLKIHLYGIVYLFFLLPCKTKVYNFFCDNQDL
jgi:hypothetical protein